MHGLSKRHFVTVGLVLLLVLVACSPAAPAGDTTPSAAGSTPTQGGKLTFAARQDIDTLDPQRTTFVATRKILGQLFDTLTVLKLGETKVYPGLAESWTTSDDGKAYTFKLKKGVKFHDGTPFDANAVKFSFDRLAMPEQNKGAAKSFAGPYKASEVIASDTVRITFERPYAPFLNMLALTPLAPVSPVAVQKFGDDFGRNPVGTGPFKFKEWVTKDHVTMVKNPDYNWAPPTFAHTGPAYLDEVTWRFVLESTTRVAVLESGEVDIAEDLAYQDVARVRDNAKLKVLSAVPAGTPWAIFPNYQKFPTNQLAVRKAMLYAIDRQAIAKTLFKGESKAAASVLQPGTPGYVPTFGDAYPFDPAKAKSVLDADGWKPGADRILAKDGRRLEMLWIYGTNNGYQDMAPLIQAQFREVGIDLKLVEQARANQEDSYRKGLQNVGEINWWFPDPSILTNNFHSRSIQTFNRGHYNSPVVDRLLDEAVTVGDPEKRMNLYQQIQEQLARDAAAIPLVDQVTLVGLKKGINGYRFDFVNLPLLYDVHF